MKLNNKICIFFALTFLSANINAQRFNVGISAAVTACDVYGADIIPDADAWNNTDFSKIGLMLGGAVQTPVNKKTTLRLEMNYIQKGTRQTSDSTGNGFYNFSFHYVEFPLMIKYRPHFTIKKKAINGLDLYAGLSVARLVKSKAESNFYNTVDDFRYLNKTDLSLLIGVGYRLSDHFNFSVRYSNALIPVFKRSGSPIYFANSLNVGNSLVFHFMLQYMFGAEKKDPAKIVDTDID